MNCLTSDVESPGEVLQKKLLTPEVSSRLFILIIVVISMPFTKLLRLVAARRIIVTAKIFQDPVSERGGQTKQV